MPKVKRLSSSGHEPCPVCHDDIDIHAVGNCDHSICFKCSTRMRVLCDQMYCAICRADLPKVVFVKEFRQFKDINTRTFLLHRKQNIYFENDSIQGGFQDLTSFKCKFCQGMKPLRNFQALEQHMRREHGLHYCDICVGDLKVFSQERKCYDRERLARHRRLGDEDDKSFKGHPLCELCDRRFLDRDELARHCRKEHFYCHFCETDGRLLEFFGSYSLLRDHFGQDHYLCEEGECLGTQFTNAFRSDIDLKAHKAQQHSRGMKRSEARQARQIEFDVQLAPRAGRGGGGGGGGGGRGGGRRYQRDRGGDESDRGDNRYDDNRERQRNAARQQREEIQAAHAVAASLNHIQRQSGAIAVVDSALIDHVSQSTTQQQPPYQQQNGHHGRGFAKSSSDFPTLNTERQDDGSDESANKNWKQDTLAKKLAMANNFSVQDGAMDDVDFPTLPENRGKQSRGAKTPSNWKQVPKESDFPGLGSQQSKRPEAKPVLNNNWTKGDIRSNSASSSPRAQRAANNSTWSQPPKVSGTQSSVNKPNLAPSWASSKQVASNQTQRKGSNSLDDFPSLSSIGNLLVPSTDHTPAPKLSMFRSPQVPDPVTKEVAPVKKPVSFNNKDFPTLGSGDKKTQPRSAKAEPRGAWSDKSSTQVKEEPPKKNKRAEGKKAAEKAKKEDISFEPPKPKKTVRAEMEEKQGKQLENLVSQQTKNKKKNKTGKKSPTEGLDANDKESNKEVKAKVESKPQESKPQSATNKSEPNKVKVESKPQEPKPQQTAPQKLNVKSTVSSVAEKAKPRYQTNDYPSLADISESVTVTPTPPPPPNLSDDFPVLGSSTKKPPPGFGSKTSTPAIPSARPPPPGFSKPAAVSKPPPGFSSKDNIENVAPVNSNAYTYIAPADSKTRNQRLISDIQSQLSRDQFDRFKLHSGEFRQAQISASDYYNRCREILSAESFNRIFPELLVLLPDIAKQQVLLQAHRDAESRTDVIKIGKKHWNTATAMFTSCPICQQVVGSSDVTAHSREHNTDFPSLSNVVAASLGLA